MRKSLGLAVTATMAFALVGPAVSAQAAAVGPTTFGSPAFATGSVDGQDGWSSTGPFDQAVVATDRYPSSFDGQALRISNSTVSGSFGDQMMSAGLAKPAGEATAEKHFDSTFQIGSTSDNVQPGLMLSVSPDNGNGARMSYLRFEDQPGGVKVVFAEAANAGPKGTVSDFPETTIATLDRSRAHTIRFSIDFLSGASNDVANIYIDGTLKHTGTTWENYYRFDPEAAGTGNLVSPVSKLLFREGGGAIPAAPTTKGAGFLIDNVELTSSIPEAAPQFPMSFEGPLYSAGSVDGQNGWLSGMGDAGQPFDAAVAAQSLYPAFGAQSLRMSNAVTSGAFGNQTFSPAIANPAGEATPYRHFDSTFQIGTAVTTPQPGLFMSVSPDDGTGGRMSWLGFEDVDGAIQVTFDDATDSGPLYTMADFNDTDLGTFAYGTAHTIRFSMDFIAGPGNDVVKIYIDGALKATGTTWEDYYRFDNEQASANPPVGALPPVVSKLEFREGGAPATGTRDGGFLIDNLTLASSTAADSAPPTAVTATPPVFTDKTGTADDTYTVPGKAGVVYSVGGVVATAGECPGSGLVTVTAEAKPGYVLAGTKTWTFQFTNVVAPPATTTPPAPSPSVAVAGVVASAASGGQSALNPGFGAKTGWIASISPQNVITLGALLLLIMAGLSGLTLYLRRRTGEQ